MDEDQLIIYKVLSFLAAILPVVSVFVASRAMRRGLTYTAMVATMSVLSFIAVGRVWHFVRETMHFRAWAEMLEYSFYIIGNIGFIVLAVRSAKLAAAPSAKTNGQ